MNWDDKRMNKQAIGAVDMFFLMYRRSIYNGSLNDIAVSTQLAIFSFHRAHHLKSECLDGKLNDKAGKKTH